MKDRQILEVTTETMVPVGAFEASIDTLRATYRGGSLELHTSPEIEMKRLLAEIRTSCYQICKCYRDDPPTGIHLREFSMLEFYRVDSDYSQILRDMKELLTTLHGGDLKFNEVTMREAVKSATGIDIKVATQAETLRAQVEADQVVRLSPKDSWNDMLFKLLIEKVEPAFDPKVPTILKEYPASMCALGKINERGATERFEIFWHGMEISNGCTELDDLATLKHRFTTESEQRKRDGKPAHPFPQRLEEAFHLGFPRSAGVAVGLDRLFVCLNGEGLFL